MDSPINSEASTLESKGLGISVNHKSKDKHFITELQNTFKASTIQRKDIFQVICNRYSVKAIAVAIGNNSLPKN